MENKEEIKKIGEEIKKNLEENLVEEGLQDNKLDFEHEGIKYRVSKPTFGQKQEAYRKKVEKFTSYLKDTNYLLEKDLKKQYLERGIDIDAMQEKIVALEKEKQALQLKLGELLVAKASDSDLKVLKDEISQIQMKQIEVSIEKSSLLEYSIEQQVFSYVYSYLTYLVAEKNVDDNWVKVWSSYKEFETSKDEELIRKFSQHSPIVLKDEI